MLFSVKSNLEKADWSSHSEADPTYSFPVCAQTNRMSRDYLRLSHTTAQPTTQPSRDQALKGKYCHIPSSNSAFLRTIPMFHSEPF